MKSSGLSSITGIAIDGRQIAVVLARRGNGKVQVVKTYRETMSLDPLVHDPELVGREIRDHLSRIGIREKHCVLSLPLRWVLSMRTELPELPEADVQSFITLQAEREFPFSLEDLCISTLRFQTPDHVNQALIAAVPITHLTRLQQVLKAARLQPVGITIGVASLPPEIQSDDAGEADLFVDENGIDLMVSIGGHAAILRTFDEALDEEPDETSYDTEWIVRQLRITLGRLPEGLRDAVQVLKIFGRSSLVQPLVDQIRPFLQPLGISVQVGVVPFLEKTPSQEADDKMVLAALGATIGYLHRRPTHFEFLLHAPSQFKQISALLSSRRNLWLGGTAALFLVGFSTMFLLQYGRLSRLETQWNSIKTPVQDLKTLQKQIRKYQPWFDESYRSLTIARILTEAFPDNGSVWAKTFEIKEQSNVACSGFSRSDSEFQKMMDRLRETKGISELQVQQKRGDNPMQFTLNFQWKGGPANEL